jgi:F0F1-type ATP synthase assembly protein I
MATNRDNKGDSGANSSKELVALATGLGFSLLIFIAGGVFLDNLFKTAPVFLLIGLVLAFTSIGVFLWKIIKSSETKA